ncbi:energy transducer TonB [Peristeroidobacter agariperforans]|uniref:energy transducer TonB n=1 Tax=Peristeroidobacter agariperforans TaxID=268404 RepID=UPI0013001756|nr:energy transducer TonB [Peristeroidobacter agariperforans]
MATDTARVQLEPASGRNESTAPFYQTAQRRRRQQQEPDAASVDAPAAIAPTRIAVPLAPAQSSARAPVADPEVSREQGGRTPWVAFAIALLSVGFAVWWVMAQRMPDIDPREVIARNLNDARAAMADGRYTDPPERSAFHYFSTVLALDPANTDAIAGIDAIADRHLTNARLLLSQKRIAEAGVALEKARRVRPDHDGLIVLDRQWRAELRTLLASATATAKPAAPAIENPAATKDRETRASHPASAPIAMPAKAESAPLQKVADVAAVAATLAAERVAPAIAESAPEIEANVAADNVIVPVATPAAPAQEPKLITMVQPQYPQEAIMRGIEGWVDVSLQVTASGDVIEPRVEDSSRGRLFNKAALAAVEQWKYEPRSDGANSERLRVRLKFQRKN